MRINNTLSCKSKEYIIFFWFLKCIQISLLVKLTVSSRVASDLPGYQAVLCCGWRCCCLSYVSGSTAGAGGNSAESPPLRCQWHPDHHHLLRLHWGWGFDAGSGGYQRGSLHHHHRHQLLPDRWVSQRVWKAGNHFKWIIR